MLSKNIQSKLLNKGKSVSLSGALLIAVSPPSWGTDNDPDMYNTITLGPVAPKGAYSKSVYSMNDYPKMWEPAIVDSYYYNQFNIQLSKRSDDEALTFSLSPIFQAHPKLEIVSIQQMLMGGDARGHKRMAELMEAFKTNKTVNTLKIIKCGVDGESAKLIADMLKSNKTITTLTLTSNNIDDEGAKALGEALSVNTSLTSLCLVMNKKMTDTGIMSLCEPLYKLTSHRSSLLTIDLAGVTSQKTLQEKSNFASHFRKKNVFLKFS